MGKACEIGSHTFLIVRVLFTIRFPSFGILDHQENAWVSASVSHSMVKSNKINCMDENLGNQYSGFLNTLGVFSLLDSHTFMVHFITFEMHDFPHQFPIAQENAAKPIRFPSYGIIYHIGNAWLFQVSQKNAVKSTL